YHPARGIRLAGPLVRRNELNSALMQELEHQRKWNGPVDSPQHLPIKDRQPLLNAENFNLAHRRSRRQVDRLWSQLVGPDNLIDLAHKQVFQCRAGTGMLIDLGLRDDATEQCRPWPVVER